MRIKTIWAMVVLVLAFATPVFAQAPATSAASPAAVQVHYRTAKIDGLEVFYREAGPKDGDVLLLLHGFPTSSHMFRELIPRLADKYRVIAPDYPGFGFSSAPDRAKFAYTFESYANIIEKLTSQLGLGRYALYVMDYGAPVGYRLAIKNPDRISALIVQNGNAYDEGLEAFWDPVKAYWKSGASKEREALRFLTTFKATYWQYTNGVKDRSLVSPDTWAVDQALLDRPGNAEIQLDLLYDYRTNLPLYPKFQAYFRARQPPMLILWGKNDEIFPPSGATPYKRDLRGAELHLFDTGHFALETDGVEMARLMRDFLARRLPRTGGPSRTASQK
jgi:pimeloyl-ACP methyl ester carboxylesterase